MRLFASGDAQRIDAPGEFLNGRPLGRVVGLVQLGQNNGQNEFGWTGLRAVVEVERAEYVLDFPEVTRLETNDGVEIVTCEAGSILGWWPTLEDVARYDLRLLDMAI